MVQSYRLVEDYDPGTGSEVKTWDLPSDKTQLIKALIFDLVALRNDVSADPTIEDIAAQLDEIKFGVKESPEISQILGEDLFNDNILFGNRPITDVGGADNARVSLGMVQTLDPFMISPQIDYRQPYGMPGGIAGKLSVKFAADADKIDGKKLTVGIITSKISHIVKKFENLQGYVTYHKHTDDMAVGTPKSYAIPQPGKLLAVHIFETTCYADITTGADYRSKQTIQEIAITKGEKVIQGALPLTTLATMNGNDVTELTDPGHTIWNFGMHNKIGKLGVPTNKRLPDDMKIKVLGGKTDAMRLYAITLNDNLV